MKTICILMATALLAIRASAYHAAADYTVDGKNCTMSVSVEATYLAFERKSGAETVRLILDRGEGEAFRDVLIAFQERIKKARESHWASSQRSVGRAGGEEFSARYIEGSQRGLLVCTKGAFWEDDVQQMLELLTDLADRGLIRKP